MFFSPPSPGSRRCEGEGRGIVAREEGKDLCVPRLVELLDFGFHFRHEGAERAFASYKEGEKGITVSERCGRGQQCTVWRGGSQRTFREFTDGLLHVGHRITLWR